MENRSSTATAAPEQLAATTTAYRLQAWLAVAGLFLFMAAYLGLAAWFLLKAWRLTLGAGASSAPLLGWLVGGCAALLGVFMVKAIFFIRHAKPDDVVEVTAAGQPRLFAFLHDLADQAGAPRPHKVFLSARVNAAVFYDLSVLNLIFPSRKNLEIGLGLVNVLTLGELKAVLAHEFGHFAQRAMTVGRWVYVAQQIAAHVVSRRDALDKFLQALSGFDLRVAWIGWLLRLIIWSIRSLVESAFSVVVLMQRALSREMEMQADLVAVTLTGSDALIHALHKLQGGDDSWNRAANFAAGQVAKKQPPLNLFAIQGHLLERMGRILNDPGYARVPPVPADAPHAHRLFKAELAQPPRMWLSHPLNHEREANAKRHYVAAASDERSAWTLFDGHEALAEQVTAKFLEKTDAEPVPMAQTLDALHQQFAREHLKGNYRGVYLGRSITRHAATSTELCGGPAGAAADLYPASLLDAMERLRTLEAELGQLRALHAGTLKPAGGILRHRGTELKPSALPQAIAQTQREIAAVEDELRAHDRRCRDTALGLAARAGQGWDAYLRALLDVLHYADHSEADLRDAQGTLANTVHIETATRKVSSSGIDRTVAEANRLQAVLAALAAQRTEVHLDTTLAERLKVATWAEAVGEMGLPPAHRNNISDWLNAADGWCDQYANALGTLRMHALEQLLVTEAALAQQLPAEAAPAPSRVPARYATLLPGQERKRRTRLDWWSRFQLADGKVPALARLGVAGCIVALVLGVGLTLGTATVTVYNGLARTVSVRVGDSQGRVEPLATIHLSVDADTTHPVEARTLQGVVIESFSEHVPGPGSQLVYNVAAAAPLVEWHATYGKVAAPDNRMLGSLRWGTSSADVLFAEPPASIQTKGSGGLRRVLSSAADQALSQQLDLVPNDAERVALQLVHARWDDSRSADIVEWMSRASRSPGFRPVLIQRLAETPHDVVLLRAEQDTAGDARETVCSRHEALAAAAPQDPNLHYVALRCRSQGDAQRQAMLAAHARWPDSGWFAYGAGFAHAEAGRWAEARTAFEQARKSLPAMRNRVGLELGRILRFTRQDSEAALAALAQDSRYLRLLLALEAGKASKAPALLAYAELARGNIAKAMELAKGSGAAEARLLRLAAASDGAPPELVDRALALPATEGVDESTVWASIGLALRMGKDAAAYQQALAELPPPQRQALLGFVAAALQGQDLAACEVLLAGLSPELRGYGYSTAAIALGNRAPAPWRDAARRLLFAQERPFFT